MAFHTAQRTFTLTTGTVSAWIQLPATPVGFSGAAQPRYLVTNPGTTVQYYAEAADNTIVVAAPIGVANGAATETNGTPILPGQQQLLDHTVNSTTPYVAGISPGGVSSLVFTYGSGD